MHSDAQEKIVQAAREIVDEMLAQTILSLLPYLEPGEMESVTYQRMEHELSRESIQRAKERMLADIQSRLMMKLAGADAEE